MAKPRTKKAATTAKTESLEYRIPVWRFALVLGVFVSLLLAVGVRLVYLHLVQQSFLAAQGEQRMVRDESIPALRGDIKDRYGKTLAISSPVMSLWLNPKLFKAANTQKLAESLGISAKKLTRRLTRNKNQGFMYVKRHLPPEHAKKYWRLNYLAYFQKQSTVVFILLRL